MNIQYSLTNGEICVNNAITGETIWKGKPEGRNVEIISPVPDEEDCIVLLDYSASDSKLPDQNLIRIHPDGTLVWRAELPEPSSSDAYVQFQITNGNLQASSWSGYKVAIDTTNGKISSATFTK